MNIGILAASVVIGATAARPAWVPAGTARRADPLGRLVLAALDGLGPVGRDPATAVVVGTAWGTVASTLRFADDLLAHGDAAAAPAAFTSSVHHHPAGLIGEVLGLHGPTATVSCGGTSGLAALRWAQAVVAAGAAPEALVVVADLANPWMEHTVAGLSRCPVPIGGGAVALRLGPGGRTLSFRTGAAVVRCDAGGATPAQERRWSNGTQPRRSAAALHGCWWPTAALAAVDWDQPVPSAVMEIEDGDEVRAWLGG